MKRSSRSRHHDDLFLHELSSSSEYLKLGYASDILTKSGSSGPFQNPEHLDLAYSQGSALRSRSTISFALQQSDEKIRLLKQGISRFADQVGRHPLRPALPPTAYSVPGSPGCSRRWERVEPLRPDQAGRHRPPLLPAGHRAEPARLPLRRPCRGPDPAAAAHSQAAHPCRNRALPREAKG